MFSADLPISILRIFSLNKVRKSWELLDIDESKDGARQGRVGLFRVKRSCFAPAEDSPKGVSNVFQKDATGFRKASQDSSYAQMGVRMERIVTIRAAIAQGSYHVSAADLALKLMGHMLAHRPSQH
jgi:anti-sigma28 factor (negative regulator of flagellin synthesis)